MLPSEQIQDDGLIQDGEENFFHFKISKMIIFQKKNFCAAFFFTKNTTYV
jgi:hypothetical protein